MRKVSIEELRKGDLILVRWNDASDVRGRLRDSHELPEVYVKDLGIYLGTSGTKRRHVLIGKDVVETWNDWGATRIPVELVESITLILPWEQIVTSLREVQALTRRVRIRKYKRMEVS